MTRRCTICDHPSRRDIEIDLVNGVPLRNIAERHGASLSSLHRHKTEHFAEDLRAAGVARVEDLTNDVQNLKERSLSILKRSETMCQLRVALGAVREARACVEVLAKLAVADEFERRLTALERQLEAEERA